MHRSVIRTCRWLAVVLSACAVGGTASAAPGPVHPAHPDPVAAAGAATALAGKRILYLSPYGVGRAGLDAFTRYFIASLTATGVNGEHILVEPLNLNRTLSPALRRQQRDFLRAQYTAQHIDLVVTVQQPALEYLLGELAGIAPGAPVLCVNSETPAASMPAGRLVVQQAVNADVGGTLRQAMALFPATSRVLVVVGSGGADQALKRQVAPLLARQWPQLTVEYTDGMTLAALLARVRQLPPHTVVLNGSFNRDATGVGITPVTLAEQVARQANAPVFALYDVALFHGGIGGSLLHLEREAGQLAQAAQALLLDQPEQARQLAARPAAALSTYDWNELRRWGGDPARLPPDTVFLHRPPSVWQEHRVAMLAALAVIAVLTALLGALLAQRRRLLAARARSRESEERYRTLVEHAPEAIVVYDADLERLVDCNARAERLFGYRRDELLSMKLLDLYVDAVQQGRPGSVQSNAQRTLEGEELVFERAVRAGDGRCFPCEVRLVRLPAVGRRLTRGSYAEISERKRAEQELLQHRNQLEHLVQQRTAALEIALRDAEAASRAKSAFLANMSHELRTPLNSVIGFSQMMADAGHGTGEEQVNLAIINRAGHHLLALINDILELSKIEAGQGQLQLAPLALDELLRDALEMVRMRAAAKGVALQLECSSVPPRVLADGAKLRQVLLNLLSNAVKFVERGSVTLALLGSKRPDGQVLLTFEVRDTGIGIAPADQQRIFAPFVQAGAPGQQAGTGLGLAISREFVRLMGGELTLRSQPGVGSDFGFTVLVRPHEAAAAPPPRAPVVGLLPQHHGLTLLVADDHDDGRRLLSGLLSPLGFRVLLAADGAAASAAVADGTVDLVLMDWRMPGLDGLQLTRWIRAQPGLRQPRIVMLTASAFEEERQQALAAGADEFLRKPVESAKLFAVLERQLALQFVRREVLQAAPAPAAPLTAAELACLPVAARDALLLAVRGLDAANAGAILGTLGPGCAALLPRVRAMLDTHQYRQLWQLLQAAPDGASTD